MSSQGNELIELLTATVRGSKHACIQKPRRRGIITKFRRLQINNMRLLKLQSHAQLPLVPIPEHHSVVNPSEIPALELAQGKLSGTVHVRFSSEEEHVFTLAELAGDDVYGDHSHKEEQISH